MCGVIGYQTLNATSDDLELIYRIFVETEIRGKHATGISYLKNNEIHTFKLPVGAEEFLKQFDLEQIYNNGQIAMIGHIRYSTSDLRYNQPFSNDKYSIVHNGVISQDSPENWPIKCETGNDSEMILHCLSDQFTYKHPLLEFPDSSQAVVYLSKQGIGGWRNGQRPLWYSKSDERIIFSSTKDILNRCEISDVNKTKMFEVYSFMDGELYIEKFDTNKKDLQ